MPLRPAAHTFLVHDEKLALEAIWPQEFEWKEDAFVLTLTPAEPVDEVFASVVIQVRPCEHSYPDTVPAITVSVIRGGLTEHHVAEIERTLQSLAKTLVGEPMVHELAQQTQEWLGRNNLPETEVGGRSTHARRSATSLPPIGYVSCVSTSRKVACMTTRTSARAARPPDAGGVSVTFELKPYDSKDRNG